MSYFYISNPYNGTEEEKEYRAKFAANACAALLRQGLFAWSPIVHNHSMLKEVKEPFTLEERRSLILDFDFSLLKCAKGMIVLKLKGWETSFGVSKEIKYCEEQNIPIYYLEPELLSANFLKDFIQSTLLKLH